MANPRVIERLYRKVEEVNLMLSVMSDLDIRVDIEIESFNDSRLKQLDILAFESNENKIKPGPKAK